MQKQFEARGVIVPLLTPMDASGAELDEDALQGNVEWLLEKGVHGFMPCGTTGEAPLLSTRERKRILEVVVATTQSRVPIIAHVGAATTAETIELALHAAEVGADAISVVTPYYFALPDDALLEHYCRVADAVPAMALFLYNIPQNTNNWITRALAEAIVARCPSVVGIKDSSGDFDSLQSFVALRDGTFQVVCGSDALLHSALDAGAVAAVSGNANVVPEIVVALYEAHVSGNAELARQQQSRLDRAREAMGSGGNLALLKAMAEWRGARMGTVRAPLAPVSEIEAADATTGLAAVGIESDAVPLRVASPSA